MPWVHDQRICPGKKFSQVELVAAMAVPIKRHAVAPEVRLGQSVNEARREAVYGRYGC